MRHFLYQGFTSVETLNQQYLPALSVPDFPDIMARWQSESADFRQQAQAHLDLSFGPTLDEYVDIFPANKPNAPIHLFIHGGYWRAGSAKDYSFIAQKLVEKGVTVAINNYALCPKVSLTEIVRQNRAVVSWLHHNGKDYSGDGNNITISGHSAGGHLAAMCALTDWAGHYGIETAFLQGICPISGLFDLAPFPYTALQPELQMSWDEVRLNSPLFLNRDVFPVSRIFYGGAESEEFARQSLDYGTALRQAGHDAAALPIGGAHHFSVLDGYMDENSELFQALLNLIFYQR